MQPYYLYPTGNGLSHANFHVHRHHAIFSGHSFRPDYSTTATTHYGDNGQHTQHRQTRNPKHRLGTHTDRLYQQKELGSTSSSGHGSSKQKKEK
jgi:hypothetical protein